MKLRYKLNLIICGFCLCGSFICFLLNKPVDGFFNFLAAYLNWWIVMRVEDETTGEDNQ